MLGSDWELIMCVGGELVPVPSSLNIGTKEGKHIALKEGSMHQDNITVELCCDPTYDANVMAERVQSITTEAETRLSEMIKEEVKLLHMPTTEWARDTLASNPFANEAGCDRDWLAIRGAAVPRVPFNVELFGDYRFAGGHIHLSYGRVSEIPPEIMVHFLDMTCGTLEVLMGEQGRRRQYYGLPSLFRPTKYPGRMRGVEYRTTSNLWLKSPEWTKAMATNALATERLVQNEPKGDILRFVQNFWPTLREGRVLQIEDRAESERMLLTVQDEFPNYDWCLGV